MEFTADQATAAAEAAGIDLKNERFTAEALGRRYDGGAGARG